MKRDAADNANLVRHGESLIRNDLTTESQELTSRESFGFSLRSHAWRLRDTANSGAHMSVHPDTIQAEKADIVARYGPWTAHNIHLIGDVYTIQSGVTGDEFRLRRVMQIVNDLASRPVHKLRVLDLACLEGMYSVELARIGASVLAIEGREANLAKAAFVKRVLNLERMHLIHDDVRNLSREQHGEFDTSSALASCTTSTPLTFSRSWSMSLKCVQDSLLSRRTRAWLLSRLRPTKGATIGGLGRKNMRQTPRGRSASETYGVRSTMSGASSSRSAHSTTSLRMQDSLASSSAAFLPKQSTSTRSRRRVSIGQLLSQSLVDGPGFPQPL